MSKRDDYILAYQQGNLSATEVIVTDTINNEMPNEDYSKSGDAVWLLLDRATTRFANNEIDDAINDYRLALEAIDFYNQDCLNELIGKIVLQDEIGAYPGEDFEQILARIYFALALLHQGDTGNAYALLRQAEEAQLAKRSQYRNSEIFENYTLADNALGKFLFATVLDKRGDHSNADILYEETKNLVGTNAFAQVGSIDCEKEAATILFVCHNGNAPYKISEITDASLASMIALEFFLAATDITTPALSSLPGIPTPALCDWPNSYPIPTNISVDQCLRPLIPWYDVAATADTELEQKMPVIVARGAARFLIRRSVVSYVSEQNENAAPFVDIAMLLVNLATKADTRTWGSLPNRIDIARIDVAPGDHSIEIQSCRSERHRIHLQKGDLCVINIFNLHPGITKILIPERFLITQGGIP